MIRNLPTLALAVLACSCSSPSQMTPGQASNRSAKPKPAADEGPMVTVGGAVRRPGDIPFRIGGTVLTAIYNAGGPSEYAAMNRVKVIRNGTMREYNLNRDEWKIGATLMPGDVIEVPSRNFLGL